MVSNSVSESCDENGICTCQSGATSRTCSQCVLNYFQTDEGCVCKLLKPYCVTLLVIMQNSFSVPRLL